MTDTNPTPTEPTSTNVIPIDLSQPTVADLTNQYRAIHQRILRINAGDETVTRDVLQGLVRDQAKIMQGIRSQSATGPKKTRTVKPKEDKPAKAAKPKREINTTLLDDI